MLRTAPKQSHKSRVKATHSGIKNNKNNNKKSLTKLTRRTAVTKKRTTTTTTTTIASTPSLLTTQQRAKLHTNSIKDFKGDYPTTTIGSGLDYKLFFFEPNNHTDDITQAISPWHDIPLVNTKLPNGDIVFNFICEIPKGTTAKYELNTTIANNPIKQDVKNGQLRHFKYGKIPFNYGALPQTWEDPKHIDGMMKLGGDNDPVDVVELSPGPLQHGIVYPVKVIGALALIDEGEVDWKILAIDVNHPVAPKLQDVHNLDAFLPSFETKVKDWFKNYKTAEGKGQNQFGYNEKLLSKTKAIDMIQECHESWAQLCTRTDTNGLAIKPLPEGFHPVNLNH